MQSKPCDHQQSLLVNPTYTPGAVDGLVSPDRAGVVSRLITPELSTDEPSTVTGV